MPIIGFTKIAEVQSLFADELLFEELFVVSFGQRRVGEQYFIYLPLLLKFSELLELHFADQPKHVNFTG